MRTIRGIVLCAFILLAACSKNNEAEQKLALARNLYAMGLYDSAKLELDSLKTLHPKAFEQIQASFLLMDSIRHAENELNIAKCDSLIKTYQSVVDSLKTFFVYQINKEYQEDGSYIPKESASGNTITNTTLRSGVKEGGQLFLESVFIGSQLHNQIKVEAKDGTFAESQQVTDDGPSFRFSNLGKQYEVIQFTGVAENGVASFIFAHADQTLILTLQGGSRNSYTLSQTMKNSVVKSYQLSDAMTRLDSLKTEKEKTEFKNHYLKKKGEGENISPDSIIIVE